MLWEVRSGNNRLLQQNYKCWLYCFPGQYAVTHFSRIIHPCPTYQLWPFSFPPKNLPKSPKWGPQNEFPGITRTKGFFGNSTDTLNFPEFPGPSRFRILGSPFSAFWGEMKLICWAVLTNHFLCRCSCQFFEQHLFDAVAVLSSHGINFAYIFARSTSVVIFVSQCNLHGFANSGARFPTKQRFN